MGRLDDYRSALLVADPAISDGALARTLDGAGPDFDLFVIDHGLGPMWHARTGRDEFAESRRTAEALYLAQQHALAQVDDALNRHAIDHAVIKGGATRLALYDNPALRACYDLDLLVSPDDRVEAARVIAGLDYEAYPQARSISRELVLARGNVEIDLHWGLLREGRLRLEDVPAMLARRVREQGMWTLSADDTLFLLLVHPAIAKHVGGWDMGLHRIADIVAFLRLESADLEAVGVRLAANGVTAAAWTTLRWTEMLTAPQAIPGLSTLLAALHPGRLRAVWLDQWLRQDWSARVSAYHWVRLLGFSTFLHDSPTDVYRAISGRQRSKRRRKADLAAFAGLAE